MTTEAFRRKIFEKTGGKAWEPPDPQHPLIKELIAEGFVRRTDGRCGFERFKDSHVAWTDAGRAALTAGQQAND